MNLSPTAPSITRVFVVEDDAPMRTAFCQALANHHELALVGDAATYEAAERAVLAGGFDVLLLDLDLAGRSSHDLIARAPDGAHVVVVSVLGDEASVLRAIEHGASGYLLKDEAFEDLALPIRQVMAGEAPISPGVARHLLRRLRQAPAPSPTATIDDCALTPREHQVLTEFARGASYKEVAARFDISVHTVRDYVKTLYRKLQVHSRGEAVSKALRTGIVEL